MQYLKTSNCVICGCKAEYWHGHVVAKERMALGNLIDKKIGAGFCEAHLDIKCNNALGNYGEYSTELMGKCIPLFST